GSGRWRWVLLGSSLVGVDGRRRSIVIKRRRRAVVDEASPERIDGEGWWSGGAPVDGGDGWCAGDAIEAKEHHGEGFSAGAAFRQGYQRFRQLFGVCDGKFGQ
ncbi:hypothetical protein U1Q18_018988, partial [Sarracenia purpurea var. burkii]